MYMVVKMFHKIDDPSKQTVAVIYNVVFTTNKLMNHDIWHIYNFGYKNQTKRTFNPSGEWPAMWGPLHICIMSMKNGRKSPQTTEQNLKKGEDDLMIVTGVDLKNVEWALIWPGPDVTCCSSSVSSVVPASLQEGPQSWHSLMLFLCRK